MTKTELEKLALHICANSKSTYPSPRSTSTVHEGMYLEKPIYILTNPLNIPYAVYYKGTCYLMRETLSRLVTNDIYEFGYTIGANAKVFLFKNTSQWLYWDEEGYYKGPATCKTSASLDYADVIPIPAL